MFDEQETPAGPEHPTHFAESSWGMANEGYEIAVQMIYGELPHSGALPDSYEAEALPIVNQQLERAGARLAMVLNRSLK